VFQQVPALYLDQGDDRSLPNSLQFFSRSCNPIYILQHYSGFHQSLQVTARVVIYLIVGYDHPHALSNSLSSDHLTFRIFLSRTSRCETDTEAYEKPLSIAALFCVLILL
jgi:hypothetical protein